MAEAYEHQVGNAGLVELNRAGRKCRDRKSYTVPESQVSRGMYRWLEREAKANERTIEGQVRFILRNEYAKESKASGDNS